MLHTSRWNGKLHPDPVVGALEEVHFQRSDRWRSPRLFTSRGWFILHLSQRPENPGALRVLWFPHTHLTLLNQREGYASGLCNRLHLKQKFPIVFGQVLIDVYRCWGENVRNVKSLNPFSLGNSEPLGPIFPVSELDYDGWVELLVLRGWQSMCDGCLGAGSWLAGLGRPPSSLRRCLPQL